VCPLSTASSQKVACSPPDKPIPFHHELAQTPNPPKYIFFYCDTPPITGGETPLIDSTAVYRYARERHPEFVQDLVDCGVRYTRIMPAVDDPSSRIGRSYYNTYQVSTKAEVESILRNTPGVVYTWLPDDSLRVTTQPVPAIRLVSSTGSYDNPSHVYQNTFSNSIIVAYLGWQDSLNDRLQTLHFGGAKDFVPLPHDVLDDIANFMQQNRVVYPWQKGDIMAVQNQLVMHSRNPCTGPRRVLASIWGSPVKENDENRQTAKQTPTTPAVEADPLVFGFAKIPREVCAELCYQAIACGYRRLDSACDYGNEIEVGTGIARAVAEGLVSREDLFITSKHRNIFPDPASAERACCKSLHDLQLSHLDEYLLCSPVSITSSLNKECLPVGSNMDGKVLVEPSDIARTWHAMEDLVESGLCRGIGVCNFSTHHLRQLMTTYRKTPPSTLHIELHPLNLQQELVRCAQDEIGLSVTARSVFGPASSLKQEAAVIGAIAQLKRKSPSQILLRWAVQRATYPVCNSVSPRCMQDHRNIFDFYLSVEEMNAISGLFTML
jgi:D-xylose reductase